MSKLQDKVVWVTGASSGIGEALVYQLSETNTRLIISSRKADALEKVKTGCKHPESVHVLALDLGEKDSLEEKAQEALSIYGHVDVLVLSGGISQRSYALDTVMDVNRQLMEVNYLRECLKY